MNKPNMRINFIMFIVVVSSFFGLNIANAQTTQLSDDWSLTLKSPSDGYYAPQNELRMHIPKSVPVEDLQHLRLEVDGIDVTSFIERDGNDAVYTPVQPLAWGNHEARVVEYAPNGEILERGEWMFEVRKTRAFQEASLNANLSLTGNERIAQRNLSGQANPFTGNGSLRLNGSIVEGIWAAQATGEVMYDDPNGNQRNGKRNIDLGNFLVKAQGGPLTLQAGHHTVSADNVLLQNGINNRGASATLATNVMHSSVTGFVMRSSPVTGFYQGFGIGNPDNQINGVTFHSYPLANETGTVKLSGVYVNGSGTQAGDITGGDPTITDGDGFGGTVDSVFFSNRVRMRGEYAHTRFDFDGRSGTLAALGDRAYTMLGSLKLLDGTTLLDNPLDWTMGLQYRYFGTNFHSVGDMTGGIFDTKVTQLFTSARWADITLDGEADEGFDNVNGAIDIATNRTRFGTLTLGWSPQPNYDDQGIAVTGFLGTPSLSGTVTSQHLKTVTPGAIAATGLDTLTNALIADAVFTYPAWNWHINYMFTRLKNRVDATQSIDEDRVTLDSTFGMSDQSLTFTPAFDLIRDKNIGTGLDTKTIHPSLTVATSLMGGEVNGRVTTNVTRTSTNDASQDSTDWSVVGNIGWQAIKSQQMEPGLLLSLSGNYGNTQNRIDPQLSLSNYQIFLNATIDWNGGI